MGQFGYQEIKDSRTAIAFYNINGAPDGSKGRKQSFIKGCSIWGGYNHAIMTVAANNINILDNVIVNMVNSGIVLKSQNNIVRRNVIANLHEKTNHLSKNLGNPEGINTQVCFENVISFRLDHGVVVDICHQHPKLVINPVCL